MRQTIQSVSNLCVLAAFCGQLMKDSRFAGVVRMALGLRIFGSMFQLLSELAQRVIEWS